MKNIAINFKCILIYDLIHFGTPCLSEKQMIITVKIIQCLLCLQIRLIMTNRMFLCYLTTNPITDKVIGCVHALADVKNSTSNIYYKLIQNCCILLY